MPWLRSGGGVIGSWMRELRPGEEVDVILVHLRLERGALLEEVRDQVAQRRRIEHRAREHVGAGLARLLEHRNRERLAAVCLLQLREPQRRRQARRTAADDEHVYVERLAIHGRFYGSSAFGEGRQHFEEVAGDAVVGDFEDRARRRPC